MPSGRGSGGRWERLGRAGPGRALQHRRAARCRPAGGRESGEARSGPGPPAHPAQVAAEECPGCLRPGRGERAPVPQAFVSVVPESFLEAGVYRAALGRRNLSALSLQRKPGTGQGKQRYRVPAHGANSEHRMHSQCNTARTSNIAWLCTNLAQTISCVW